MFCKSVPVLLLLLGVALADKKCNVFDGVKATIYTGSASDPQNVNLHGIEDLKTAYRVEIDGALIPVLCAGALKDLDELDTLIIKNAGIGKIETGAFENTPRLRILDLTFNSIKEIPYGVFNSLSLRRLNLTGNSIEKIASDAFDQMPLLQVIELDHNELSSVDADWFKATPLLYRITMDHNQITSLPKDAFKNLVESDGGKRRNLDLWLTHNKIHKIHPFAFRNIQRIETLWLSYNEIETLPDVLFTDIEKIHSLNMDFNKITCLSDKFLDNLKVDELDVDSNPIDCECLRKLRKWSAKKNTEIFSTRTGLTCLRQQIDNVIVSQKKYYEDKISKLDI